MLIVFDDERPSDSPFVERVWRCHSERAGLFHSIAMNTWEMVVTRHAGLLSLTVRGPETRATAVYCPAGGEWLAIRFKLGTLMPHLPASRLVDGAVTLPAATGRSFWLHGASWPFPTYDNADTFVDRLVREGLLVRESVLAAAGEPVIAAPIREPLSSAGREVALPSALSERALPSALSEPVVTTARRRGADLSLRSAQRRFAHATGLTLSAARQIERSRYAAYLLKHGVSILDAVHEAGYYDQPHLTRSLKYYIGQTPAQLACTDGAAQLSFLYKTTPRDFGYDLSV